MYMHDVLAKLKEIAETTDNRDINDAIKSAEMTQTSAYRGPQKEGPEPIVEEVHEVAEAQSPKQKAAFEKMLAAKNGNKEEATEDDEDEEDEGKEIQEIDDSLNDILRLSGQSGVLGMSTPTVIVKEDASTNPYTPEGWVNTDVDLPDVDPNETEEYMDEEAVEETIEVPVNELAELLRLAGQSEVTEEEFEPINAPKEVYGDAEEQLIAMSGGLNGPKNMYPTAAGGDNPMSVQPLDVTTESLYKKYAEFVAENNENV